MFSLLSYRCGRCKRTHSFCNDMGVALWALDELFEELSSSVEHAELRQRFEDSEGKMLAVLVVANDSQEVSVLRSFSGDLGDRTDWPGFVPAVLRREKTAAQEAATVAQIRSLTAEMRFSSPERTQVLRQQRRQLSRTLMESMHDVATLQNRAGHTAPLRQVFDGSGIPSGTGTCALPKLLHAANVARLHPLAWAEAYFEHTEKRGKESRHQRLDAPCERRCDPILGFLLCDCV